MGLRPTQRDENLWVFDRAVSVSSHKFGVQPLGMDRRRSDQARGPWAARQRGPVITFVEKSAGCLGFGQGDSCPDFRIRCFSAGITCCHYTRRFLNALFC